MAYPFENKIKYIKVVISNSNNYYISPSYKIGESFLYLYINSDNKIYVKTPVDAVVYFITDDAMYRSETSLLTTQYSNCISTFIIKTPQDFTKIQKRKYFRVKFDTKVEILFTEDEKEEIIPCKSYDLSAGGIKVILYDRPEFPAVVDLKLMFENKTVTTKAKLVKTYYDQNIPNATFEFLNLNEEDFDLISNICFKKRQQDSISEKKV